MSKLLTDLMEAERKRRRLANSPGAGDAHSGASGQDAAGPAAATLARTAADEAIAAEAMRRAAVESRIEAERNAAETAARQARQASELAAAAVARVALEKEAEAAAVHRARMESEAAAACARQAEAERQAGEAALARKAAETQAAAATVSHQDMSSALAASRSATPRPTAAETPAPAKPGPQSAWWRLFAATALALTAGIGTGIWLGKPPAAPVRPWSDDQGALRLRLDDRLMNPPRQEPRPMPRDRSQ